MLERNSLFLLVLLLSPLAVHGQSPTWQRLNGPYGGNVIDIAGNDSGSVFVLTVDELDKLDLKSGGWIQLMSGLHFNFIPSVIFQWGSDDIAFLENGLWDEYGAFWSETRGDLMSDISAPGFFIGDTAFVGTRTHGVARTYSSQYWYDWNPVDSSHWGVYSLIRDSSDVIFAGSVGSVYCSSNHGVNWTALSKGLPSVEVTTLLKFNGSLVAGTRGAGTFIWDSVAGSWTPINPGREPWVISSFVIRGGTLFASSLDAGVFMLAPGNTWTEFNNGLPARAVTKLFLRKNGELLAGTTDGVYSLAVGGSLWKPIGMPITQVSGIIETPRHSIIAKGSEGIFRSTDAGDSWSNISINAFDSHIGGIAQSNSGTLVAASQYDVFRSRDGGRNWTDDTLGLNQPTGGFDPEIHYVGGSRFLMCDYHHTYASTNDGATWTPSRAVVTRYTGSGQNLFGASNKGVCRSRDSGMTWDSVFQFGSIAAQDSELTVSAFQGANFGIYYSSDAGDTWKKISDTARGQVYASCVGSSGAYYASNIGVLRSPTLSQAPVRTALHGGARAVATNGPTVVAFDVNLGTFYSTDSGTSWKPSQGLYDSVLSLTAGAAGNFFASTIHGIYRSSDGGVTFTSASAGLEWTAIGVAESPANTLSVSPNGHLFAYAPGHGLARSTDEGDHWKFLDTTLHNPSPFAVSSPFAIAPSGRIFRNSTDYNPLLMFSDDDGASWTTTSHPFLLDFAFDSSRGVFGFQGVNGNKYLHYSSDNGLTWKQYDTLTTYGITPYTAIDRFGLIYLANLYSGGTSQGDGIHTTRDLVHITPHPLYTLTVSALATDKFGYAYGGAAGLLRSTDGGDTWTDIKDTAFPVQAITAILPTDQYLFAGTNGAGILRTALTGSARESVGREKNTANSNIEIFPNPADAVVTITSPSSMTLPFTVYNAVGSSVANGQLTDGCARIDTRELPSGIYHIIAAGFSTQDKLIVLH